MFTQEFEFTDYKGQEKKASYTFSLEKDELLVLELGNYGGLRYTMKKWMAQKRPDKVLDLLQKVVLSAIGEISPDGNSFYKTEQIREEFKQTKVFHDLMFKMMNQEDAFQEFMLRAIPAEVAANFSKEDFKAVMESADT